MPTQSPKARRSRCRSRTRSTANAVTKPLISKATGGTSANASPTSKPAAAPCPTSRKAASRSYCSPGGGNGVVRAPTVTMRITSSRMVTMRDIEYEFDGTVMIGRLALPDGDDARPAVLIAHEGPGLDDHQKERAGQFAELGYVAFALD